MNIWVNAYKSICVNIYKRVSVYRVGSDKEKESCEWCLTRWPSVIDLVLLVLPQHQRRASQTQRIRERNHPQWFVQSVRWLLMKLFLPAVERSPYSVKVSTRCGFTGDVLGCLESLFELVSDFPDSFLCPHCWLSSHDQDLYHLQDSLTILAEAVSSLHEEVVSLNEQLSQLCSSPEHTQFTLMPRLLWLTWPLLSLIAHYSLLWVCFLAFSQLRIFQLFPPVWSQVQCCL